MIVSGPSFDVKTKQTALVDTFIPNVLTAEQAEARDTEQARAAHNAAIKEQMDANDLRATRALCEAIRTGDTARLEVHEAVQAELRAQLIA